MKKFWLSIKCFFGFHNYVQQYIGTKKWGFSVTDSVCKNCGDVREWKYI
jgi:hypothetical protein